MLRHFPGVVYTPGNCRNRSVGITEKKAGPITPSSQIPKVSLGDVFVWCPPDEHIAQHAIFLSGFLHFPISGE
jgi:hypothetical protein